MKGRIVLFVITALLLSGCDGTSSREDANPPDLAGDQQTLDARSDGPPADGSPGDAPGDGPATPDTAADTGITGTLWYVDSAATGGGNDGTSWADAWQSFADIEWSQIQPGDGVMVSGGTSEKTYHETLKVEASGAVGKPIVIRGGLTAGHAGQVIIDGQDKRVDGIYVRPQRHVTLSGFKLLGHTDHEVYISGSSGSSYSAAGASRHVVIEKMEIYTKARGVFIQTSDNVTVRGCDISTPSYSPKQTDGIYSQRNHDNVYDGNTIVIYNTEPTGHDDCIQMFEDTSTVVRNNYIGQVNSKKGNAQGIYATMMHGTTLYYNNVVNLGNAQSNGLAFRRLTGSGTVEVYGNTVFSIRAYHTAEITETPDPVVKNNIFFTDQGNTALDLTGWSGDASKIDNNLYWTSKSIVASVNGSGKTWSAWQGLGFDAHGVNAAPKVVSVAGKDFHLQSTSPAVDKGTDIGAPYNIDRDGVSRPQGKGWDMGAYEK